MLTRRGLLLGILAAGMAPAVVKAGILMPSRALILPGPGVFTLAKLKECVDQLDANNMPLIPMEIGRWEGFRFIESPYLPPRDSQRG